MVKKNFEKYFTADWTIFGSGINTYQIFATSPLLLKQNVSMNKWCRSHVWRDFHLMVDIQYKVTYRWNLCWSWALSEHWQLLLLDFQLTSFRHLKKIHSAITAGTTLDRCKVYEVNIWKWAIKLEKKYTPLR